LSAGSFENASAVFRKVTAEDIEQFAVGASPFPLSGSFCRIQSLLFTSLPLLCGVQKAYRKSEHEKEDVFHYYTKFEGDVAK
jgi:hypothetical protein